MNAGPQSLATATDASPEPLKRVLGGGFAIAAGVGTIIGLGILRTPGEIAAVFPRPYVYVGLWLLVGLFVLMSTAVVTELAGMTPRSGGPYVLVRRAFGPYPGFLMGWIDWLSYPCVIALKSTVLAEYAALLWPVLNEWRIPVATGVTTAFAALQIRGVALGSRIQLTAAACMGLVIVALTLALVLAAPVPAMAVATQPSLPTLADYGLVLAAIVYTYDGWLSAAYFGGEIRGGGGAVARACLRGVVVIVLLYVGLNAALAFSVPLADLAGHELALSRALDLAWGEGSGTLVLAAAVLILLAHQNIGYMSGPRALYALSLDGLGARRAATVHLGGNPVFAVLLTWMLAVALIVVGGFEFLLNLSTLFFLMLYVALLVGVIRLRVSEPDTDRPWKAWGHPLTTLLGVAGWLGVTLFVAWTAPRSAVSALLMMIASVPVYLWMARWRRQGRP